jgi:hypothetical protein
MLRLTDTSGACGSCPAAAQAARKRSDLLGLQPMSNDLSDVLHQQGRALEVHPHLVAVHCAVGVGSPRPTRSGRLRPGDCGSQAAATCRPRVAGTSDGGLLGEALTADRVEEHLGIGARAMSAWVEPVGRHGSRNA